MHAVPDVHVPRPKRSKPVTTAALDPPAPAAPPAPSPEGLLLLALRAGDRDAVCAALRRRIAAAAARVEQIGRWRRESPPVHPNAAETHCQAVRDALRRHRLESARLAWLESGDEQPFEAPAPGGRDEAARVIAVWRLCVGVRWLHELLDRARRRPGVIAIELRRLEPVPPHSAFCAARADAEPAAVEGMLRDRVARCAALRAEAARLERALHAFREALPGALSAAVESAGGREALAAAVREARAADGQSEPDPRLDEIRASQAAWLDGLQEELARFGAADVAILPGRFREELAARRRELEAQVEAKAREVRAHRAESAADLTARALGGELDAFLRISELAEATPGCFPAGFAEAWCGAATEALLDADPDAIAGLCVPAPPSPID
jgi:hypothetical protein